MNEKLKNQLKVTSQGLEEIIIFGYSACAGIAIGLSRGHGINPPDPWIAGLIISAYTIGGSRYVFGDAKRGVRMAIPAYVGYLTGESLAQIVKYYAR